MNLVFYATVIQLIVIIWYLSTRTEYDLVILVGNFFTTILLIFVLISQS